MSEEFYDDGLKIIYDNEEVVLSANNRLKIVKSVEVVKENNKSKIEDNDKLFTLFENMRQQIKYDGYELLDECSFEQFKNFVNGYKKN